MKGEKNPLRKLNMLQNKKANLDQEKILKNLLKRKK